MALELACLAVVFADGRGALAGRDVPVGHRRSSPGEGVARHARPRTSSSRGARGARHPGASGRPVEIAASDGAAVIAEIKRRSPSKGDLAPDLDPAALAADYEDGGAALPFGAHRRASSSGDRRRTCKPARGRAGCRFCARTSLSAPNDVADARLMGADAVLLIVAAFSEEELASFLGAGVEARARLPWSRCTTRTSSRSPSPAVPVSSVSTSVTCATFEVDTDLAARLAAMIPDGGDRGGRVRDHEVQQDVSRLAACGFQAVLVGESRRHLGRPRRGCEGPHRAPVGPRRPSRAMAGG